MSKVAEAKQGPDERLSAFLERPLEVSLLYTPSDLEDKATLKTIKLAFVTQSAPDICKGMQRLEGFSGKNRSELLEIAQKVFDNLDSKGDQKAKMWGKPQRQHCIIQPLPTEILLQRNQCNYCRGLGRWKDEPLQQKQVNSEEHRRGRCPRWRQVGILESSPDTGFLRSL